MRRVTWLRVSDAKSAVSLIVSPAWGQSLLRRSDGVDKNGNSDNIEHDNDEMDSDNENDYNSDIVNYDDISDENYDSDSLVRLNVMGNAVPLAILGLVPFGRTTSSEIVNFYKVIVSF